MKTLKKLSIIVAVGLSTIFFSGCSDYLDVSDDLAAELSMEEVFNNTGYARRFHRYIYSGIPDVSNIIITSSYAALTGLDNPWPAVSDELKSAQNNVNSDSRLPCRIGGFIALESLQTNPSGKRISGILAYDPTARRRYGLH